MSSSAEAPRPYHHGNLRQALLDAAFGLLSQHPAAQLSLREVARAAGVSHAAPYHYFPDKASLLQAVGAECMQRLLQAQQRAVAGQHAPAERLVAMGEAYVRFARQEPHAFALVFDPQLCPAGRPHADMAGLIQANEALLRDCVDALLAGAGQPAGDGQALGAAVWGTVHGLAHLVVGGHLPQESVGPALRALLGVRGSARGG